MPNERLNKMVAKLDELNNELDPEIIKIRDKIGIRHLMRLMKL